MANRDSGQMIFPKARCHSRKLTHMQEMEDFSVDFCDPPPMNTPAGHESFWILPLFFCVNQLLNIQCVVNTILWSFSPILTIWWIFSGVLGFFYASLTLPCLVYTFNKTITMNMCVFTFTAIHTNYWSVTLICLSRWHYLAYLCLGLKAKQGHLWTVFGWEHTREQTNIMEECELCWYHCQENYIDITTNKEFHFSQRRIY